MFNPQDWYWKADDDRVFASARSAVVTTSDAGYLAFLAAHGGFARWPTDIHGAQTIQSIQDVLTPYGLSADLKNYAANVRYAKEVGGRIVGGVTYPTDRDTQSKLTAAAVFAQVDNTQTFKWKLVDGTFTASMTATQMITLAAAIGGFVNACFSAEQSVGASIDGGTVTTKAQVDAVFAAI
jgi:hypothetical protein